MDLEIDGVGPIGVVLLVILLRSVLNSEQKSKIELSKRYWQRVAPWFSNRSQFVVCDVEM